MLFFLVVLSVSVAVAQGKAQYDPYYYINPYPYYPNYPVGFKQAAPVANYPDGSRLFFGLFRTTTTTTSTTTCTVYTSSTCTGKRRRSIFEDVEESDAIQPTAVDKIAITPLASIDSVAGRSEREANPQFVYVRDSPQGAYPFQELQPAFGQNYLFYASPNAYSNQAPIHAADPRWGVYLTTTTITTTTTSRSTPSCSSSSNFNTC